LNGSLRLGRIFGVPIGINYTWFVIFFLVAWTLVRGYFPLRHPGWPAGAYWAAGLITALLFFASVLAHELSHSLVAARKGISIRRVTLFIFGGVAEIADEPSSASDELQIALAGPAASFALAALFWAAGRVGGYISAVGFYLSYINLMVGLFNLVPGFPLDGGRVLRAVLWGRWGDLHRATRYASMAGQAVAYLLILAGVGGIASGRLVTGFWWILIGWFLLEGARAGLRRIVVREALSDIPVGEIMNENVVTVDPGARLDEVIGSYFLRYDQGGFPVERGGRLVGFLTLQDIREVPGNRRSTLCVADVMTGLKELRVVRPEDSAYAALVRMGELHVGRLPVVKDGKLVGIVSRDHLIDAMQLKMAGTP